MWLNEELAGKQSWRPSFLEMKNVPDRCEPREFFTLTPHFSSTFLRFYLFFVSSDESEVCVFFQFGLYEKRKWAEFYSFDFSTSLCKSDHFKIALKIPDRTLFSHVTLILLVLFTHACSLCFQFLSEGIWLAVIYWFGFIVKCKTFGLFRRPLFSHCAERF